MDAWGELTTERPVVPGALLPIPGSRIREWAREEWPDRPAFAARVIRRIDQVFLAEQAYRRKLAEMDSPPPPSGKR